MIATATETSGIPSSNSGNIPALHPDLKHSLIQFGFTAMSSFAWAAAEVAFQRKTGQSFAAAIGPGLYGGFLGVIVPVLAKNGIVCIPRELYGAYRSKLADKAMLGTPEKAALDEAGKFKDQMGELAQPIFAKAETAYNEARQATGWPIAYEQGPAARRAATAVNGAVSSAITLGSILHFTMG